MPNKENTGIDIGGHHDLTVSKPVFWLIGRKPGSRWSNSIRSTARSTTWEAADLFEMTNSRT